MAKVKRRKASIQNKKKFRQKERKLQTKAIIVVIVIAAFAVSAFNITGFVSNKRTIAFIALSDQLQGSEKTLYNELSQKSVVTIMPLSDLQANLDGYSIIAVSKQAGDTFTDEKRSACKKIADYKKPMIFFSGQLSTVGRFTVGNSMAPQMPWEIVNSLHYPTEPYSGIIIPYQATGNLPAVVESDNIIKLVKRTDTDAYLALFLSSPKKAFFSFPDNEFTFTEQGKNLLDRTLTWLESA